MDYHLLQRGAGEMPDRSGARMGRRKPFRRVACRAKPGEQTLPGQARWCVEAKGVLDFENSAGRTTWWRQPHSSRFVTETAGGPPLRDFQPAASNLQGDIAEQKYGLGPVGPKTGADSIKHAALEQTASRWRLPACASGRLRDIARFRGQLYPDRRRFHRPNAGRFAYRL